MIYVQESEIHGLGVFASRDLKRDVGHCQAEFINHSDWKRVSETNIGRFCLGTPDETILPMGDIAFTNHSSDPNCEIIVEENIVYLSTLREIKLGEELTINYGEDYDGS